MIVTTNTKTMNITVDHFNEILPYLESLFEGKYPTKEELEEAIRNIGDSTGTGLTPNQVQQLADAYAHSQSPHVSASDIPTKTSELTNDSNFATETYVAEEIKKASLEGSGSSVDLTDYQRKTDDTLNTTDKTIVGAINEIKTVLNDKVDKVAGKTLTTNDYTNEEKQIVADLKTTVGDSTSGLVKDVIDLKTNGVSQDNINSAIEKYLQDNPVQSGATAEQAAQIEANRTAIGDENSGLVKEVNNIKNTELQNLNTAIQTLETIVGVDETVGDKSGLPEGDTNIIASINRIDGKASGGSGLTDEQINKLNSIDNKVDKIDGKGLSTNDYTNEEKTTLANLKTTVGDNSLGLVKDVEDLKTNGVSQDNINSAVEKYLQDNPVTISLVTYTDGDTFIIEENVEEIIKIITEQDSLTFFETGEGDVLGVKLSKEPSSEVTVNLSIANGYCNSNKNSLVFTTSNYNEYQYFTLTGVEDANDYSDKNDTITLSSEGIDPKIIPVTIKNTTESTEVFGNTIVSNNNITINENSTVTLDVNLDKAPTNNQTITINKENENITLDKNSLTFTAENYNIAQTITITGVHNETDYLDKTCRLTLTSNNVSNVYVDIIIKNIDENPSPDSSLILFLNGEGGDERFDDSLANVTSPAKWIDQTGNGHDIEFTCDTPSKSYPLIQGDNTSFNMPEYFAKFSTGKIENIDLSIDNFTIDMEIKPKAKGFIGINTNTINAPGTDQIALGFDSNLNASVRHNYDKPAIVENTVSDENTWARLTLIKENNILSFYKDKNLIGSESTGTYTLNSSSFIFLSQMNYKYIKLYSTNKNISEL